MKKIGFLFIAVIGNSLGTVIMSNTSLGMTAWGSSASNFGNYFNISLGSSFIILSTIFYILAVLIRKEWKCKEFVFSFIFLFSFGSAVNLFELIIPSFNEFHFIIRIALNIFGLLILLFAIAVHIRINIAVHPMDVYMRELHIKFNSIKLGTYICYLSAFIVAIVFGVLEGEIINIGIGTIITIFLSGLIIHFYDEKILQKINLK